MPCFNEETLQFVRAHSRDDVALLALQAARFPGVDMPAALTQIAGRQAAAEKLPSWAAVEGIRYPAHLAMEQCSSELTARYKAGVVRAWRGKGTASKAGDNTLTLTDDNTLTDLTGGFGVDCAFLSPAFKHVTYVERQAALCRTAAHNFALLGLKHITVCNEEATAHLQAMAPAEWLYIDPARRDEAGGKVVAIAACEPDVAALQTLLLQKGKHALVKLSPMLDLSLALHDLPCTAAVHVVAVENECKELLLVLQKGQAPEGSDTLPIHCVNLRAGGPCRPFTFTRKEERACACRYTATLRRYLYEPDASLLKAGAFRTTAARFGLEKLHPNSHLYTGDNLLTGFPGRRFLVEARCGFGKKELKTLLGNVRQANLTARNFPLSVAALRRRLNLAEGGDTYLFATTMADNKRCLIKAKPCLQAACK
ncbi:MAG: SAM-dependent methyltransferase [Prevotellaceae bacterium]|nr:SAM-dependent methyltransferase [Prevotellaceae bacterium]